MTETEKDEAYKRHQIEEYIKRMSMLDEGQRAGSSKVDTEIQQNLKKAGILEMIEARHK